MVFTDMCSAPQIYKDQDPHDALGLSFVVTHWHQRSRQCSCILSRRRGSRKEKGYTTGHVCFMRISKVSLKDPQQLSASGAWLLIDA